MGKSTLSSGAFKRKTRQASSEILDGFWEAAYDLCESIVEQVKFDKTESESYDLDILCAQIKELAKLSNQRVDLILYMKERRHTLNKQVLEDQSR